ncbi:hypothetical protein M9Y10_015819 [Tritrichomonas musculus]|uniref:Uncharacterized protein n=1 Tax=Tritrichomonas musculus TaxID=1915356 RepID=A0ABR2I4Q0_9EUKA
MSQQNARDAQEIYEQSFEKVWDLCVMLGIPEDTLEAIADETPYDEEIEFELLVFKIDIETQCPENLQNDLAPSIETRYRK